MLRTLRVLYLLPAGAIFAASEHDPVHDLLLHIGIVIIAATLLAYLSHIFRQPLILAYLAAGVLIGPNFGLGLIRSEKDIATISELGLVLLLFLIGMEIDLGKIRAAGKSLITVGITQFALCAAFGLAFFSLPGFAAGGRYDAFYLAICCALSSTAIVAKLLYTKFELDTLAGRLTLGVLVFQDIWAIVILGVQPNLANPEVLQILFSFAKAGALVTLAVAFSKFLLPALFSRIAKIPELTLLLSVGWCFAVCAAALGFGLSLEMGALIAGVAISTFPYNLDVVARTTALRDFFITLFFVSLGMKIPNPLAQPQLVGIAAIATLFVILTRFLSVYPVLFALKNGNRVSILTSLNLANVSEFSLVIAALGFTANHIAPDILSVIIFTFVLASVLAPYLIRYNQTLQEKLTPIFEAFGLRDKEKFVEPSPRELTKEIALLGFFKVASSFVTDAVADGSKNSLKDKIVVVDFNQTVHAQLRNLGIPAVYGDISHVDTLHHIGLHHTRVAISTIPDTILVGTSNEKLIKLIQEIAPHAKIIVTAENPESALKMYAAGADYVFLPRQLASAHLMPIVRDMLAATEPGESSAAKNRRQKAELRLRKLREQAIAELRERHEIIS